MSLADYLDAAAEETSTEFCRLPEECKAGSDANSEGGRTALSKRSAVPTAERPSETETMFDAIARILFHPPRISHRVKTVLDVNAGGEPAAEGEMHGRPKAAQNKTTANKPIVFGEDSMSFAGSKRIRHLEYFLLHDARPTGPSVGLYANRDIPASVVDDFGRRYLFAGIAPRQWNGDFDLDALQTGEFILKPGLVYRLEQLPRSWIESLFG